MKKNVILIVVIIVPIIVSILLAHFFIVKFHPTDEVTLRDKEWSHLFTNNEYPELKDLGKSFLTLLIGVFVASITFSEKIVNHQHSSSLSRLLLFMCWISFLLAIVLTGSGLCFLFGCFEEALHSEIYNDSLYELLTYSYVFAGILFGFGLSFMLTAGAISFFRTARSQ